jgi:hypothetical protein
VLSALFFGGRNLPFIYFYRRTFSISAINILFRRPILHFSLLRPTLLALGFSQAPFPSAYSTLFSSQADAFGFWLLPDILSVGLFGNFLFSGRRFWLLASPGHLFRRPILHFSFLRPTLLVLGSSLAPFPSAYSALFFSQADAFGFWLHPGTFSVGLFGTFLFSGRRFWSLAPHWHLFRRPVQHFSIFRPTRTFFLFCNPA